MLSLGEFPHALSQDGPTKDVASASATKRRGRGPSDRIGCNFSPGAKHLRVESLRFRRQQAIEKRRRERELAALLGCQRRKSPPPPPQRRRSSLPSIVAEEEHSVPAASLVSPSSSSLAAGEGGAGSSTAGAGAFGMSAFDGDGDKKGYEGVVTRVTQDRTGRGRLTLTRFGSGSL